MVGYRIALRKKVMSGRVLALLALTDRPRVERTLDDFH